MSDLIICNRDKNSFLFLTDLDISLLLRKFSSTGDVVEEVRRLLDRGSRIT